MLLLRLGLRRGEGALLYASSFKEDFDPVARKTVHWLDVEEVDDPDPRYEQPGLKTETSRRQLPLQEEIVELVRFYIRNYRGRANHPHLLISQKACHFRCDPSVKSLRLRRRPCATRLSNL